MPFLPDFQSASFRTGAPVNNQFFPLSPGTVMAYTAVDTATGEDVEANDVFVTSLTNMVNGVQTLVVRDTAYEDGLLVEETLDYYAQDTKGNVWYLGETVINYVYNNAGKFVGTNTNGAWLAGVDGALAGWIMPAKPTLGFSYFNEFAPGVALDEAEVIGVKQKIVTDLGRFTTLKTADTTELEPDIVETKYYAPGVGTVRVEEEFDAEGNPGLVSDLTQVLRAGSSRAPNGSDPADEADFISDGSTNWVTIISEGSEFENSLGYYAFDPTTGVIGEARIIFDGSSGDAGDTISIQIPTGTGIGFFLVPDSSSLGIDVSKFDDGGLFLMNMLTGGAATLTDGMPPIVTDEDGQPLPIQFFHVLGASGGADFLNPGIGYQAVEWDLGQDEDGNVLIGFEDQRQTSEDFDGDFNDLMIVFGDAPVDPDDFSTIGTSSLELFGASQMSLAGPVDPGDISMARRSSLEELVAPQASHSDYLF